MYRLTRSPLCHCFCRKCEDRKNLRHDLPEKLCEVLRERDPGIVFQTLKEELNPFEEVPDCLIVRRNVPHCL